MAFGNGFKTSVTLPAFRFGGRGETRSAASGAATLDANGRPVRLSGVTHDITERKLSEEALQASVQVLDADGETGHRNGNGDVIEAHVLLAALRYLGRVKTEKGARRRG